MPLLFLLQEPNLSSLQLLLHHHHAVEDGQEVAWLDSALGRGPKRQNAKNVTELIFFTVFIHINDLEKV